MTNVSTRKKKIKIKKEEIFKVNPYPNGLRSSSSRIRIHKRISSYNPSSSSNSSSDDENKGKYDEDGFRSYDLILPNGKINKFGADKINLAVMQAKDGIGLEKKFRKMKLKFTRFDVENGNVQEPIFEVLNKTRCVPQPREIVRIRCRYNLSARDYVKMMGEMRLHYTNKHHHWCKKIDFDQFIRCDRRRWGVSALITSF
jgi:hypothetical protein